MGLDLGNDTLWKAPDTLFARLWTQRSYSGGGGQGGKGGQLAACTPPSGNRDLLQAPSFLPTLSSRSSIQGPGLTVCAHGNGQSSTSPVRHLVLCVPQHLTGLPCAHSSHPHPPSRPSSLISCPCRRHRNHSCPSFCDSPGLCRGAGGAAGFG